MIEVVFGWSTRISKAKHSQKLRCGRLNSMLEYLFILPEITPNGMKHTVVGLCWLMIFLRKEEVLIYPGEIA